MSPEQEAELRRKMAEVRNDQPYSDMSEATAERLRSRGTGDYLAGPSYGEGHVSTGYSTPRPPPAHFTGSDPSFAPRLANDVAAPMVANEDAIDLDAPQATQTPARRLLEAAKAQKAKSDAEQQHSWAGAVHGAEAHPFLLAPAHAVERLASFVTGEPTFDEKRKAEEQASHSQALDQKIDIYKQAIEKLKRHKEYAKAEKDRDESGQTYKVHRAVYQSEK